MPQAFPPLGPEYEPFLYAVVWDDANGAPLTVVSAIARSGADPWREAARIARLPKSAAFEALALLIPVSGAAESKAIVQRLFSLLPTPRDKMSFAFVGSAAKDGGSARNMLVPIVVALMLGLALVLFFKAATRSGMGPHESPAMRPSPTRPT